MTGKTHPRPVEQQLRGQRATLSARFNAKVGAPDPLTGCMEWMSYTAPNGYGQIDGVAAHRVSYLLANGQDPGRLYVLHSCDNPPCVNPDHLRVGTQKDNSDDKFARGRQNPRYKVTENDVAEIRRLWTEEGLMQKYIAQQFLLGQQSVSRICAGLSRAESPAVAEWQRSGSRTRNTVLSDADVESIRSQYARGGTTQRALAKQFGVGQPHISYLIRGLERASGS